MSALDSGLEREQHPGLLCTLQTRRRIKLRKEYGHVSLVPPEAKARQYWTVSKTPLAQVVTYSQQYRISLLSIIKPMRRGTVALHRRLNLLTRLVRVERESSEISVESVVEFATGIRLGDEVLIWL